MKQEMQNNIIEVNEQHENYLRIAQAIQYLQENHLDQPNLKELADVVGVSEYHFQRMFSEWAGVSPKQFLQYLTKENAKERLKESSVLDAAIDSGLSGPSRLHDLMISCEGVTPGEYKNWGKGVEIAYGIHSSPFGYCFIGITKRGVCKLAFYDSQAESMAARAELDVDWPEATIVENQNLTAEVAHQIFCDGDGTQKSLHLLLKGSPFQIKVWEAVLSIPQGQLHSYQQVANAMGKPTAVRAVASAVARNNIAYLIPCHRVIRSSGVLNNYRWGDVRKAAIIGREAGEGVLN